MVPRIKELYNKKVKPELVKEFKLANVNEVPVFEKIVLNVGVGEAKENTKMLTAAAEELSAITGQKAVITRAKKSISNFKLRKGMTIGAKVTLRGDKMWEFFDRFVNVALPRVRDFRGLNPDAFDNFNNYSMGIKEQIIFPEIDYDKAERIHGLDITFVIKNRARKDLVKSFLEKVGFPFRKPTPVEPKQEPRPVMPSVEDEKKDDKIASADTSSNEQTPTKEEAPAKEEVKTADKQEDKNDATPQEKPADKAEVVTEEKKSDGDKEE
jgi:large subunit ribosomal protein L5